MKANKLFFVVLIVFAYYTSYAQESSSQDTTIYEYYVEETTKGEPTVNDSDIQNQQSPLSEKIFFGGGFGASFGDYLFINVSPIVGYRITERLAGGLRIMYQYTTFEYYVSPIDKERYNGHDFGIGPFVRYTIYGPVFLQAEYEFLSYDALYYDGSTSRNSFDSFMAGGGLAQPIGRNAAFFLTVLYNFSYDGFDTSGVYRNPYNSPWVFRVGVTAGF